jgi:hypothetical protein
MRLAVFFSAVTLFAAMVPDASQAAFQDENILVPLPAGFKIGFRAHPNRMDMTEFVPSGETVDNWSQMITEQIFYGRGGSDPDALPNGMVTKWQSDCPGGAAGRAARTVENGYPVSIWTFLCPLNPATGKPETMFMKVTAGKDSLYSVQYAYRQVFSPDMIKPTMSYLHGVLVCDTRDAAHLCPRVQ